MNAGGLARAIEGLPDDAELTLRVGWIRAQLGGPAPTNGSRPACRDLTAAQVAEELERAPSTVRTWLQSGALEGYKLRGREWRVTRSAVDRFLEREGRGEDAGGRPELDPVGSDDDLASWRRV